MTLQEWSENRLFVGFEDVITKNPVGEKCFGIGFATRQCAEQAGKEATEDGIAVEVLPLGNGGYVVEKSN